MGERLRKQPPQAQTERQNVRPAGEGRNIQLGDARVVYPESPHVSAWFQSEIERWILQKFHEEVKVDPLPTLDSESAATRSSGKNHRRG